MALLRNISHVLAALFNNRADFHRRWKEAAAQPAATHGWTGRWQGEWVSEANGHRGALKCLLTTTKADEYQAMFHAVYARILTVCYNVHLHGRKDGHKLKLAGKANLGKLAGGVYHYEGEANEATFNCTYRCAYDHGTFRLRRMH